MISMPRRYLTRQLALLSPGAKVVVTPWSLVVSMDGECFLDLESTYDDTPCGTVCMPVTRLEYGWEVDIGPCTDHRWHQCRVPDGKRYVAISVLHGRDDTGKPVTLRDGDFYPEGE